MLVEEMVRGGVFFFVGDSNGVVDCTLLPYDMTNQSAIVLLFCAVVEMRGTC